MSKKLNETQHQAIIMLAGGQPASSVAIALNVRKETISRWKQLPEFQAELNILLEDIRESTRNRLASMAEKALEVLEQDLQSTDNPTRRSRTAFKILQLVGGNTLAFPDVPLPTSVEAIREKQEAKEMWGALVGLG